MVTKRFCSQCGTELTPGAKFCRNCGAPVKNAEPEKPKCPGCGAEIDPTRNSKFCRQCGYKLVEETPVQSLPEVKAEEVPVQAAEPEVKTEEVPVQAAEPKVKTEEVPVQAVEPEVKAEEVPVQAAEPEVKTEEVPVQVVAPEVKAEEVPVQVVQPVPSAPQQRVAYAEPQEQSQFPIALVIGFAIGLVIIAIVAVTVLYKKDIIHISFLDKLFHTEETVETEDEIEEADADQKEADNNKKADGLVSKADALVEANGEKVLNDDLRADAMQKLVEAMDLYKQAGPDQAAEGMNHAYTYYVKGTQKQVDMLMTLDVAADIYSEIVSTIDDTIAYGNGLTSAGFNVDMGNITSLRDNIEEKYKALFIEEFNKFIDEYQWNVRHNEEFMRGAMEAFEPDEPDDPIRLRYAYAKAWLVHQEVVEGINDGSLDSEDAFKKIVKEAEDCDYCEFLMQEAESNAYRANNEGAAAGSQGKDGHYFGKLSDTPIISDSDTKEYSFDDIAALNLNPAELRYARYEIYARHDMKSLMSQQADAVFGTENGIDPYKFMSYNDFGEYSTDNRNGLTVTERHNIRSIMQYELSRIDDGYFGLE